MNKEILFRGKRIIEPIKIDRYAPDGWVYGDLIDCSDETYILPTDISGEMYRIRPYRFRANDFEYTIMLAEVDPKTIGQFTGVTDKNGKKIFEGDILRGFCYPFQDGEGNYNYYAEVFRFENNSAFGLVTHKNPKSNVVGISDGNCNYIEDWDNHQWEIIGNIYDNPELLEK